MTEKIELFDYRHLNKDHKAAAAEIVELCKEHDQLILAELIKQRFELEEPNIYDLAESKFVKACFDAGIYVSVQGFVSEGNGDKKYQLVCINDDVRKLDNFIEKLQSAKDL